MSAVAGGLAAAVAFAATSLFVSRATRLAPPISVAAVALALGLVMTVPAVLITGLPDHIDGGDLTWLAIAGVANVISFLLGYTAFGLGQVGVIAPIVSTEGAFTAVFAVIGGEHLSAATALLLGVVAVGVAVAARGTAETAEAHPHAARGVTLAVMSAAGYGLALYATGRASADLPLPLVLLPARLVGTVFVTLPLLARRRITFPRVAFWPTLGLATGEVVALVFYGAGARDSVAVTGVLAAQFAAIATLAAAVLWHERLTRSQIIALVTVAAGVTALAAVAP